VDPRAHTNTGRAEATGMTGDEGLLVLQHQQTRLTLDPHRGGVIRELKRGEWDILRPTPAGAGDDPFDTACFAMVPFVNRVANGRFEFDGQAVRLERNWSKDPHPIHGQGWRSAWTVTAAAPANATLRFDGGADEWPWSYTCEQRFELTPDGLSVELSIRNRSGTPMPAMLGLHPYFPDARRARMEAHLPRVWLKDSATLPVEEVETPEQWGFEPGRAVQAVALDNAFSRWNGIAHLRWPEHNVTVRATGCKFLHVYTPVGQDFFCIEPQTAAPGALGRDPREASIVAPGERVAMRVHFSSGAN
jgi:aldose 1-epimerase